MRERRKAEYLRFEEEPDEEFWFFLAEQLHSTVLRLQQEMSQEEFIRWGVYFGRKAQREELAAKGR